MSQDNELFNMEQARLQGGRLEAVKRLLRYAMQFKRTLLVALLILAVAVAADLAGPFVAKRLIDEHISGIERVWYETQDTGKYAVSYDGKRYKREDHFGIDETKGEPARVLQVGRDYYLINGSTDIEGQRSMTDGGLIQIAQGSKTTLYEGKKLDTVQLFTFFQAGSRRYLAAVLNLFRTDSLVGSLYVLAALLPSVIGQPNYPPDADGCIWTA